MREIANVYYSCGRAYLDVAGVAVAMEGDKCRQLLPDEVAQPIPQIEMEHATIGGTPIKDMPLDIVRVFRGESWRKKSLEWAAIKINAAIQECHHELVAACEAALTTLQYLSGLDSDQFGELTDDDLCLRCRNLEAALSKATSTPQE